MVAANYEAGCNAAGKHSEDRMPFPEFLVGLAAQLGIPGIDQTFCMLLKDDSKLNQLSVPRYIFPGESTPSGLSGRIGLITRKPNVDEFDLEISGIQGPGKSKRNNLRIEAKQRLKLSNHEFSNAASKLVLEPSDVGILVSKSSCGYWSDDLYQDRNYESLRTLLKGSIGTAYFVKSSGSFSKVIFSPNKISRMILLQIPDSSLTES